MPESTPDIKSLQKALVFTRLVYEKPVIPSLKRPTRQPGGIADVLEAASLSIEPESPHRHVDAFGVTDERLLPWSRD